MAFTICDDELSFTLVTEISLVSKDESQYITANNINKRFLQFSRPFKSVSFKWDLKKTSGIQKKQCRQALKKI